MVKQFSRGGGKVKFFKEVIEIFREGFKLLLERWNWDFNLMKGASFRGYFKRVEKHFQV